MSYLNISTGAYPLSAADVKAAFPNTSFPSDVAGFEQCLPDLGYAVVASTPQPVVDYTKNITEGNPVKGNSGYEQVWIVSNASTAEIAERTDAEAASVRSERNIRLAACDWTQLPDAPVDHAVWAGYRQNLRDISSQPGFPWEVVWPSQPS